MTPALRCDFDKKCSNMPPIEKHDPQIEDYNLSIEKMQGLVKCLGCKCKHWR